MIHKHISRDEHIFMFHMQLPSIGESVCSIFVSNTGQVLTLNARAYSIMINFMSSATHTTEL